MKSHLFSTVGWLSAALLAAGLSLSADSTGLTALFTKDGVPAGWTVRRWDDVSKPAADGVVWKVEGGVLHGSNPRGTWLMSEKEYSDFILEFEFKLGETGNSGCALRAPMVGDPAFDGMELQMADVRYNPQAKDSELTGGLYRAVAPPIKERPRRGHIGFQELSRGGGHVEIRHARIQVLDEPAAPK